MRNETAIREIESLDYHLQNHTDDYGEESHIAMMMAVKALKQESVLDRIRTEIEQLPTSTCTATCRIKMDADDFKKNVLAILDRCKAESEVEDRNDN